MVGEFPELQGVMGGYYALAQGEDPQVAAAIRDHYKPVGQGDEVPTAPVTVAVSLADKLDTICQFLALEELRPTGSKDPYAIRRAALGVLTTFELNGIRLPLVTAVLKNSSDRAEQLGADISQSVRSIAKDWRHENRLHGIDVVLLWNTLRHVPYFFADRLKVQQREAGVRHDLIDAVFALGGEDDLVRLLARVRALQAFVGTEDGANLLGLYKRAANILKKEGYTSPLPAGEEMIGSAMPPSSPEQRGALSTQSSRWASDEWEGEDRDDAAVDAALTLPPALAGSLPLPPGEGKPLSYTPEKDEAALHAALDSAEPAAARAVAGEDFEAAMAALATLRAPIDAFFDTVTVNDPDPAKRSARLALLARVRDAVHTVADFSKIEG